MGVYTEGLCTGRIGNFPSCVNPAVPKWPLITSLEIFVTRLRTVRYKAERLLDESREMWKESQRHPK